MREEEERRLELRLSREGVISRCPRSGVFEGRYFAGMSQENVELTLLINDAWNRRDAEALVALWDPQGVWFPPFEGMGLEGDTYHCFWVRHGRFTRVEDHLTLKGALHALGLSGDCLGAAGVSDQEAHP
jgi:hypothetical protein